MLQIFYLLFNLLLASITNLLCFFFFLFFFFVIFNSFSTIPVEIENARLKLALATISTGAPITVANDGIEMLPVVTDKATNDF